MKKRIIAIIITLIVLCITVTGMTKITVAEQEQVYTKQDLNTLIEETESIKFHTHTMAESARELGWNDEDELIKGLQNRWFIADANQKIYTNKLNNILELEAKAEAERIAAEQAEAARQAEEVKWATKAAEYPAATQIWRYMKSLGWNDYVCAGIMGNLMAEVGGQTLNIKYTSSSSGYYGMCQWNTGYSQIRGADLATQCDFLRDTIKYEFDTFGFKYQKGFNFSSFLNMTDAQAAALAFAKSYERCGSGSYGVRQSNAIKAYNYFVY